MARTPLSWGGGAGQPLWVTLGEPHQAFVWPAQCPGPHSGNKPTHPSPSHGQCERHNRPWKERDAENGPRGRLNPGFAKLEFKKPCVAAPGCWQSRGGRCLVEDTHPQAPLGGGGNPSNWPFLMVPVPPTIVRSVRALSRKSNRECPCRQKKLMTE